MDHSMDKVAKALQQSECPMSIQIFTEYLASGADIRVAMGVESSDQVVKACGCSPSMTVAEIKKCRDERLHFGACWYKLRNDKTK